MYKNATHVLYRSDFKDETFWEGMLELHGITDDDDVDEPDWNVVQFCGYCSQEYEEDMELVCKQAIQLKISTDNSEYY